MKHIFIILVCCLLTACQAGTGSLMSAPDTLAGVSTEKLALTLMEKSGLNDQIGNVPSRTKMEIFDVLKQSGAFHTSLPKKTLVKIERVINTSFCPDAIRSILATHLSGHLSRKDMRDVLVWLDSPLGRKITHIEKVSVSAEAYKEMATVVPTLKLADDYDERLELVHEIDQSVKATDVIIDRMMTMQIVSLSVLSSAFPAMDLPSEAVVRRRFQKNRNDIAAAVSREIALTTLYTYRGISRDDIRAYISFMNSDAGKRYHQAIQEGTTKAYACCGKKFTEALAKEIKTAGPKVGTIRTNLCASYPQMR